MNALTSAGSGFHTPFQAYGDYASTSASRTAVSYSQESDIVIHTLEGDTVTISSSAYDAGGYETYESLAAGRGGSLYRYGETAYFESRRQMSISVAGDLNREELEDINSILGTLDEMMKDLVAGNLESALSKSSQFADIDAVASFSADLSITATLTESRFESASASSSAPENRNEENDIMASIDRIADKMSNALKPRNTLLEYLVPEIDNAFSHRIDRAPAQSGDWAEGAKWAHRFVRRLMDGLKPGMPQEEEG